MARVGGRSLWLAWPIGVICATVIAALLWLAVPGIPGAIEFTGNLLRGSTSAPVADGETGGAGAPERPASDCRSLYPDRLWAELTWTPEVLLSQDASPPASATALASALTPTVRFTCTWRVPDGRTAATTLAAVPAGSAAVAQAALAAEGFTCAAEGDAVHCERVRGEVTEIHDLRGDAWLSSVLTAWLPEEYGAQVAARAFPG